MIIDGKAMALVLDEDTRSRVEKLASRGMVPGLATVLVGADPASQLYIKLKHSACLRVGIRSENIELPEDISEVQLLDKIRELNRRRDIQGILLQLPIPKHLDSRRVVMMIDPKKDVDGFHPQNMGSMILGLEKLSPCTPKGIIYALDQLGVELKGAEVVMVGHSNVVGKPLAIMMLNRDATVQVCHVYTKNLAHHTRRADILVVAAGVPGLIKAEMVKPGAYVFDVGINRLGERIVGDVDFDAVCKIASAITPVPGGVGPLTIAMLLRQTVQAAEAQVKQT